MEGGAVIASDPISPPTAAVVITNPASAAGRPSASTAETSAKGSPPSAAKATVVDTVATRSGGAVAITPEGGTEPSPVAGRRRVGASRRQAERRDRQRRAGQAERGQRPRRRGCKCDDGHERRAAEAGDVVGERVPCEHPGRPRPTPGDRAQSAVEQRLGAGDDECSRDGDDERCPAERGDDGQRGRRRQRTGEAQQAPRPVGAVEHRPEERTGDQLRERGGGDQPAGGGRRAGAVEGEEDDGEGESLVDEAGARRAGDEPE